MKRFSIILLGALAMVMAGCSKDDHTASNEPVSNDWMVNLDLPVPIEFSAGSIDTKAAYNSMDDLLSTESKQHYFGLFAVDKEATSIDGAILETVNNQRAFYAENADGSKEFKFGNYPSNIVPVYYPLVSDVNYDFYGYYTRKNSVDFPQTSETNTQALVTLPVGSQDADILWAKATAKTYYDGGVGYDGYNARYVRKTNSKPLLDFHHVTSCLKFQAVFCVEGESAPNMDEVKVNSITFKEINTSAQLCVIDLAEENSQEGKLINATSAKDVSMSKVSDNLVASKEGEAYSPVTIGDDFFIAPQNEPLEVELVIAYIPTGGSYLKQTVTYTLDPAALGASLKDSNGADIRRFEAGYQYGFNIKVYSPEKISFEVKVEPYKEAFDGGFADIVIE